MPQHSAVQAARKAEQRSTSCWGLKLRGPPFSEEAVFSPRAAAAAKASLASRRSNSASTAFQAAMRWSSACSLGMPPLQTKYTAPAVALPLALSISSLVFPGALRAKYARALRTSMRSFASLASSASVKAYSAIFWASAFFSASSRPKATLRESSTSHADMSCVTGMMALEVGAAPFPPAAAPGLATALSASSTAVASCTMCFCHPWRQSGRTMSQKTKEML
mmetsp:Transcript_47388/g.125116  ORF Transcript_47388/g.125116 Transcript_47388/m.125116 type:complete len:222 (-) Transcript_47388:523-1188(-)